MRHSLGYSYNMITQSIGHRFLYGHCSTTDHKRWQNTAFFPKVQNAQFNPSPFVSISDQKSFTIRWPYKERFYCITFHQSLTYRLRRRTTFCWCARCGRGVVWSSGGRHPYRSALPDTCWRRYGRLPGPLTTAVPVRLTPDVCTVGTRLREPSYVPGHRYGSLDLGENIRKIKMLPKQECIPAGCVPAACWPYPIVLGGRLPTHPPPVMHAGKPTPLSPCGQKEWQMLVKTLPCPSFVCRR